MEAGIDSEVVEYPHAKVVGIQFGLLSTKDIMRISVFHKNGEPDLAAKRKLTDSRLGLPNVENECKSCGERVSQKCEGHFGHLLFPYPVYHPNHVSDIVKILDRLCLSCLSLKNVKKKKPIEFASFMDVINGITALDIDNKATVFKGNLGWAKKEITHDSFSPATCSKFPFGTKEEPEELTSSTFLKGGPSKSSVQMIIDLSSDEEEAAAPSLKSPRNPKGGSVKVKTGPNKKKAKRVENLQTGKQGSCKYCKQGVYPKLHVKLEREVQSNKNVVEKIYLELNEGEDLQKDYLKLLGKTAEDFDDGKQYLLPCEALRILTSLTKEVVQRLQMDDTFSRPEALVLESLLIPPNCNRIPECPPAMDQLKFGSDRVTNTLSKVLTKLPFMKASKATAMTNRLAIDEMQLLLGDYFRIKGGPKVRGNKEPTGDYVRVGQPAKQRPKVSLNNLQKHFAAKVSSFSCRAVLTGDTYLSLDEIGIPFEIAKGITVSELVTKENLERLQGFVNNGPKSLSKTGALYYIRGGLKVDLNHCEPVSIAVGDTVGRHLQDGDYVFCNRPPSVHKHSMLGLRAHILDIPTLAINPLICKPLGADFDGDCLTVFVPQCIESKTEIKELMMVQKQMLTSHGGQCTFALTQDALLAAYMLTSSYHFLTQSSMEQGCMSTGSSLLVPAIIKSPKGRLWTGAQFLQLALPKDLNYNKHGILILSSEIVELAADPDWLGCSNDSLLHTIILQCGNDAALSFLGSSQSMLVQWLSQKGFSVGPYDAYATALSSTRSAMKQELKRKMGEKEHVVSKKLYNLHVQLRNQEGSTNECLTHLDKTYPGVFRRSLEKLGLQYMQSLLAEVEDAALKHACTDNAMWAMVTSGSKGSRKKFVEQFGFLGLQLHQGKSMHLIKRVGRPVSMSMHEDPMHEDTMGIDKSQGANTWEEGGLVKNSFVEGLDPHEFFIHTVSHRETMIRQALRVSEPGYLYKNMMLFARDVYIDYDGTVRNHHSKLLIQFRYGGAKENLGHGHSQSSKQFSWMSSMPLPSHGEDVTVLAGEPVGILAAAAIVQPAYQMLLESPNQLNDLAICPLELLQETLYSRKNSVLKRCDGKVILFLRESRGISKERAAVKVNQLLRHVTLEMLLSSVSVNFEGHLQGVWEGLLPAKKSPWIVHFSLHKLAMNTWSISVEEIVEKLKNLTELHEFGSLSFFPRECCDSNCPGVTKSVGNPCISFCTVTAQSPSIQESLSRIKSHVIPRAMKLSIRGDWRLESVAIVPMDASSEPWIGLVARDDPLAEEKEVVIEIIVKKNCIKKKIDAWHIVQELCSPVLELIDWSRSISGSIQGVAELYGIEAAHRCVYQRLKSVLRMFDKSVYSEHMLLMTDLMTHSGNVIGLNAAGFREFSNKLPISAPMTQSLFQNSIKHIQDAAFKGKYDDLSGTVPSICWGKPATVGTGSKFDILWRILV